MNATTRAIHRYFTELHTISLTSYTAASCANFRERTHFHPQYITYHKELTITWMWFISPFKFSHYKWLTLAYVSTAQRMRCSWRNRELAQQVCPSPFSSMLKSSKKYFLLTPLMAQRTRAEVCSGLHMFMIFHLILRNNFGFQQLSAPVSPSIQKALILWHRKIAGEAPWKQK